MHYYLAVVGNLCKISPETVPNCILSFCLLVLTFPIANSPLSKRSRTPRNKKATPKPANPTPISKDKEILYYNLSVYIVRTLCSMRGSF